MDDYYSLTSILADNHKLPCTFTLDVPGLGYLESSTETDLKQGAKAELPLWLSHTLAINELTTFSVPQPFGPRVRAALNASAPALHLSNLVGAGGWWYRFGARVASIWDKGDTLLAMLLNGFAKRLPPLQDLAASDYSLPESGALGEDFREGMEADERELFAIGQDSQRAVKAWYDSVWGRKR